jgi:hypothetical protein
MNTKGRVTIPTDMDAVPETLDLLKRWGADAIRDCDGTEFPQELKDTGAKIYATYYTTRKDNAWAQAFDQMLERRAAGTLELPMKSHGYLYAILAGMADKTEAAQEAKREEDARLRPRRDTVQVRGQALEIGAALDVVYGGKDPALAAIDQSKRNAAPIPAHLRERMQQIKRGQP